MKHIVCALMALAVIMYLLVDGPGSGYVLSGLALFLFAGIVAMLDEPIHHAAEGGATCGTSNDLFQFMLDRTWNTEHLNILIANCYAGSGKSPKLFDNGELRNTLAEINKAACALGAISINRDIDETVDDKPATAHLDKLKQDFVDQLRAAQRAAESAFDERNIFSRMLSVDKEDMQIYISSLIRDFGTTMSIFVKDYRRARANELKKKVAETIPSIKAPQHIIDGFLKDIDRVLEIPEYAHLTSEIGALKLKVPDFMNRANQAMVATHFGSRPDMPDLPEVAAIAGIPDVGPDIVKTYIMPALKKWVIKITDEEVEKYGPKIEEITFTS